MEQAELSRQGGYHELCCFSCQQAAEKAVKALHLARGQEASGNAVAKLIDELPEGEEVPADLPDKARVLDAYYVAPRYPNGHPEGAPFEHCGKLHSDQAIDYAHEIIELIRTRLA